MILETYGTGERLIAAGRHCARLPIKHLVLLPVPTTKDSIYITNTETPLAQTLSNIGAETILVGYELPAEYKKEAELCGCAVLDLFTDEEYLAENAMLTATATLGYLLSTVRSAPKDIKFGIVGYGRIGSRLAEMLLFLGAGVKVYTTNVATAHSLGKCGIDCDCVPIDFDSYDFSEIQILINTAPKDMRKNFADGRIPYGMRVIELASGNNFAGVNGVERLPSLPEKNYPESAGIAYARAVERFAIREGRL